MTSKFELPIHFRDWNTSTTRSINKTRKPAAQKPLWKRPVFIGVAVAVVIILILVIAIPLAVLLPKKGKNHNASVLLPLYIYPDDNSTWAPLYESLVARPSLQFTVIVNPASGPGSSQYPDESYTAALTQLSTYPNVKKVGYVRTGYASRNLSDVISEINVFAGWSTLGSAFTMEGIFFDESPHEYTADAVQFMLEATKNVKSASGIRGDKLVIRNPGVVPASQFSDTNTDVNVVFEQSYSEYKTKVSELSTIQDSRAQHCYMVHSLPSMTSSAFRKYVYELSRGAKYLFVTTNDDHYYESFASDWSEFATAIPT
ncbi:hypothetical protein P153DRAFT_433463 [Dothidotthia symphoricarpi CBS 119687]|uniref:Spherulin 4-like cell surface protein n=1 Tax=Dothidotthia symphoricarpi CBS 119687 TaxID=1392245 RepID=A0A6A6A523_9PLEO|nr:uncharacterized protein P153DRAFT_433463 [Dothidotthia symphoricarpi CBS 119687]KAF2126989.1 hypothetical protein P153DRAFT_433463 [Dothidotthia symphoricarpi CBS 119687]